MNKLSIGKFVKNVRLAVSKHSPEILTGIGIAGMVTTTVLAVRATPKALKLLEEKKNEEWVDELAPIEVVKVTWKCYIPAAVTGVTSIACLIGASSVNLRRNAALATAYKLSETALTEYRDKVVETIGEKKEKAVRDAISKDRVDHDPVNDKEVIITGKGETLCYDALSGRYFKSDIDRIKKAENELNHRLLREDYISLNDFYDEIGLSFTKLGDDLGWHVEKGLIEIHFSSQLASDGTPCLALDYQVAPDRHYSRIY